MGELKLKGTWSQALLGFFGPLLVIFLIRCFLVEPFVVPSGSMIPSLLVHDHIFVNKLAFGLHLPLTQKLKIFWAEPRRGDIVVFRYPEDPSVFYVKRLIGLPGDTVEVIDGDIYVNNEKNLHKNISIQCLPQGCEGIPEYDKNFDYYIENGSYTVRYANKDLSHFAKIKIPPGKYFMMGDNRDQSSDSRFWGFVPRENLVGKAMLIWLSCRETLASASFICDPSTLRFERLFKTL